MVINTQRSGHMGQCVYRHSCNPSLGCVSHQKWLKMRRVVTDRNVRVELKSVGNDEKLNRNAQNSTGEQLWKPAGKRPLYLRATAAV